MQDSIFAKIVAGEIPCHKVYEDEQTLAFLDVYPKHEAHTLIIPKVNPAEYVWDLDDDTYQAVMATAHKVANRQRQVLSYPMVHMAVVGTDIPYAHVHVIPFNSINDIERDQPSSPSDSDILATMAAKLYFYD